MGKGLLTACLIGSLLAIGADTRAGELLVGAAAADITPSQPVALDGQFRTASHKGPTRPSRRTWLPWSRASTIVRSMRR